MLEKVESSEGPKIPMPHTVLYKHPPKFDCPGFYKDPEYRGKNISGTDPAEIYRTADGRRIKCGNCGLFEDIHEINGPYFEWVPGKPIPQSIP